MGAPTPPPGRAAVGAVQIDKHHLVGAHAGHICMDRKRYLTRR